MRLLCCILAIAVLSAPALASASAIYPGDAVRVNGEAISYQRFHGFYLEYRNAHGVAIGSRGDHLDLLTRLRREAMDEMIEQALVAQAASAAGIEAPFEVAAESYEELRSIFDTEEAFQLKLESEGFTEVTMREHIRRTLASQRYLDDIRSQAAKVKDAELEDFYRANLRRLTFPEEVRVRHILLTWKPLGTQDDRAAIREQMQPILERARSGEDFAALARELSDDYATKNAGGDTGYFQSGTLSPTFEAAAFALDAGEISEPVESPYGVHIIKLEGRREPYLLPLDEVRDQLREYLRLERAEEAVAAEIARLRAAADIEILIPLKSRKESTHATL